MIEVRDLLKVFDTRGQVVRAVDNVTTQAVSYTHLTLPTILLV